MFFVSSLTGCSSTQRQADKDALQSEVGELRNQLTAVASRLESMEARMTSMNDKVDSTRNSMDLLQSNLATGASGITAAKKPKASGIEPHPSEGAGVPVETETAQTDPASGFVNDAAVQGFQQAKILFDGGKYPDAILAFTGFLQNFADHALAGAAQYYVGECYFQQKEYKLASTEYKRVLTSYDRSHVVPQTLQRLAEAEDHLNLKDESAHHRNLLAAMFPLAPANSDAKKQAKPRGETESAATSPTRVPDSMPDPVPPTTHAKHAEIQHESMMTDETPPTAPMPEAQGSQ